MTNPPDQNSTERLRSALDRLDGEWQALECNRLRGSNLVYAGESYGYLFDYSFDTSAWCLNNIAMKAGLAITMVG